jgi:hypothetical protein
MPSSKEDTKTASERLSVTQKPSTIELVSEMTEETHLTKNELFNVGIDTLYFLWSVLRKGGAIGVKFPDDDDFKPVEIFIPGMTKPFSLGR